MKRFRDYSWLIFFMRLMRAGQGRPVALAVLLGLSLLNLYSESPGVIPRPALFDKLDDMVPAHV